MRKYFNRFMFRNSKICGPPLSLWNIRRRQNFYFYKKYKMDIIWYVTFAVTTYSSTTSRGYGIQFTVVRGGQSHWYSTDRRIKQESRPRSESPRPSGIDNFLPRGTHDIWSCTVDGIDPSDPPLYRGTVIPCGERACDGERGGRQS